ncbi:MAG TPA: hypothetical protein VNC50_00485, partial [Planctomycetia bacterium]|nr:hypothetical protein [Planctomycetia bacterium]
LFQISREHIRKLRQLRLDPLPALDLDVVLQFERAAVETWVRRQSHAQRGDAAEDCGAGQGGADEGDPALGRVPPIASGNLAKSFLARNLARIHHLPWSTMGGHG